MATKTVARKPKPAPAKDSFATRLRTFLTLKAQLEQAENHNGKLKNDLKADVESLGYKDASGSWWFDLDEPVVAPVWDEDAETVVDTEFNKVKLQRRAPQKLDADKAEELLAKKGILEECQATVVVLDEDAIQRAFFEGKLTKAEYDRIYPVTVSFAFTPQKAKAKAVKKK